MEPVFLQQEAVEGEELHLVRPLKVLVVRVRQEQQERLHQGVRVVCQGWY